MGEREPEPYRGFRRFNDKPSCPAHSVDRIDFQRVLQCAHRIIWFLYPHAKEAALLRNSYIRLIDCGWMRWSCQRGESERGIDHLRRHIDVYSDVNDVGYNAHPDPDPGHDYDYD